MWRGASVLRFVVVLIVLASSFFFFLTHFFYASLWGKLEKGSISRGREHGNRRRGRGQTVCEMNIGNFPGRYLFAAPYFRVRIEVYSCFM